MSIRKVLFGIFGAALASTGLLVADDALAETVIKIKAQGVAIVDLQNFPLSDGSTVQWWVSRTVSTELEGDMAGQSRSANCRGFGKVTPEGVYSGVGRCDETWSAEDVMTFDYSDDAKGGDWVLTGGTGKFKGAKGSGHNTYTWGDPVYGDRITYTTEGTITLP